MPNNKGFELLPKKQKKTCVEIRKFGETKKLKEITCPKYRNLQRTEIIENGGKATAK